MAQMYNRVLRDLIDAGIPWTYNSKTLRRGGGNIYEFGTPAGKQWIKIHTSCPRERRRYWFGVNHTALEQVDSVVFWMSGESRLYFVPAAFLRRLLEEYKQWNLVTIREGQWMVDVHARSNQLELPRVSQRYSLNNYAVEIPLAARCG